MGFLPKCFLLPIGLVPSCLIAQEVGDPLTMHLTDCVWDSGSCGLQWTETTDSGGCHEFELRQSQGAAFLSGSLHFPSKLLSHGSPDYIDTIQAILFSYQLSRYDVLSLCGSPSAERAFRFTSIDAKGLVVAHLRFSGGRCSVRVISDTSNQWLVVSVIRPVVTELEMKRSRALKIVRRAASAWSIERSYVVLPDHNIVEEQTSSGLDQWNCNPSRRGRRLFLRSIRRLVRRSQSVAGAAGSSGY